MNEFKIQSGERLVHHKGLKNKEWPPNSLEGIFQNYHGKIECDAFLLKDGNIAILHERDFNLSKEEIENLTLSELEQLRLPSNEPDRKLVPALLKEFIGLAEDTDTSLALEIRSSSVEKSLNLARKMVEQFLELDRAGGNSHDPKYVENKVNFESFSVKVLNEVKKMADENQKDLKTALYWPSDEKWAKQVDVFDWEELNKVENREKLSWNELGIAVAANNKFNAVELQPNVVTADLIKKAHDYGLKIGSSITADQDLEKRLIDLGVDYILTDK